MFCRAAILTAILLSVLVPTARAADTGDEKANPQAQAAVQQFMAGPSVFIENAGQWADSSIRIKYGGREINVGCGILRS